MTPSPAGDTIVRCQENLDPHLSGSHKNRAPAPPEPDLQTFGEQAASGLDSGCDPLLAPSRTG